ncbi:MAG: glycosyltransferase [Phaeodactylibacter sp.]|nr:glycosyltransferase [Phaeodactylibacter sp.]MCB9286875.1 glycosyltransferase [Lewinellaceae bacterium]
MAKNLERIVLLSPAHPLRGGIASSTERLAQELQEQGYTVCIYSFSLQYPGFLFPGKTQYTEGPPPEGLDILPIVNSINPFNWWKVGRRLRKEAPDLAIARFWLPFMAPAMGTILRLAKGNGHTKTMAITDNVIPHEKRPGDRLFTRYFIDAVDAFIVMSRSVGEDIRQFAPQKPLAYIPHPIFDNYGPKCAREESLKRLGLSGEYPYLLFFGFIRDYKGLDLLLRAMGDPKVRELGVRLIVAGEFYGSEEPYRAIIREEGIEKEVIFFSDYIPNEEVKYYFGAANLVVQPYKSATQSGISQLAYHFERPMLVTGVGGLPEIVEHEKEGYVVEVNAPAIAEAIVDFFTHGREAEMGEGVRRGKQRFSWDNMVKGIESLFHEI